MAQDQCPKTTVPRLMSQDHCPKTTVPRPMSQDQCPKTTVPRPMSQDQCPKTNVPRPMSQDCFVPRLLWSKTVPRLHCPKTIPRLCCPKTVPRMQCPKTSSVLSQDSSLSVWISGLFFFVVGTFEPLYLLPPLELLKKYSQNPYINGQNPNIDPVFSGYLKL